MKLSDIGDALAEVVQAYHYHAHEATVPYAVWAEDYENGTQYANNGHALTVMAGTVTYYTADEDDPTAEAIQGKMTQIGLQWRKSKTWYEDETDAILHEWEWTACVAP